MISSHGWPPPNHESKAGERRTSFRTTNEWPVSKQRTSGKRATLVAAPGLTRSNSAQHDEHDRHWAVHYDPAFAVDAGWATGNARLAGGVGDHDLRRHDLERTRRCD